MAKDNYTQMEELYATKTEVELRELIANPRTPLSKPFAVEELRKRGIKAEPDQSGYAGGARINGDEWRERQKVNPAA